MKSLCTRKKSLLYLTGALALFIALAFFLGTGCIPWVRWSSGAGGPSNQMFCGIAADGSGGTILSWYDPSRGLLAQRIDANGNTLWNGGGVTVCDEKLDGNNFALVADGTGGAVIAWVDQRSGSDIRAQRVGSGGNPLWGEDGVLIFPDSYMPFYLSGIPDGEGGAILCWRDDRNGNSDIFAQKVGPDGEAAWGGEGVAVCSAEGVQHIPVMTGNGEGGAVIAWEDSRSGIDVYVQEISSDGSTAWAENGVAVCALEGSQERPVIAPDRAGGAVIAWCDSRAGWSEADILAQKLDTGGNLLWASDGTPVCTAGGRQSDPVAVEDGANGAVLAWVDSRPGSRNEDIYAQRLDAGGNRLWAEQGKAVCKAPYGQSGIFAVSDGRGGAILTWTDNRKGYREYGGYIVRDFDVFVQRLNSSGTSVWGLDISNVSPNEEWSEGIVPDGTGGAVVAWGIDNDIHYILSDIDVRITRVTDWSLGAIKKPSLKELLR